MTNSSQEAKEYAESLLSTLPGIEGYTNSQPEGTVYDVTCKSPFRSVAEWLIKGGWEVMHDSSESCVLAKGMIYFILQ
jgi:hypothetical protein